MQPTRRRYRDARVDPALSPKMTTTPNLADFPDRHAIGQGNPFCTAKTAIPGSEQSRTQSRWPTGKPEEPAQRQVLRTPANGLQNPSGLAAPGWLGSTPGPLRLRETPAQREVLGGRDGLGECISAMLDLLVVARGAGVYDRADHRAPTCWARRTELTVSTCQLRPKRVEDPAAPF